MSILKLIKLFRNSDEDKHQAIYGATVELKKNGETVDTCGTVPKPQTTGNTLVTIVTSNNLTFSYH